MESKETQNQRANIFPSYLMMQPDARISQLGRNKGSVYLGLLAESCPFRYVHSQLNWFRERGRVTITHTRHRDTVGPWTLVHLTYTAPRTTMSMKMRLPLSFQTTASPPSQYPLHRQFINVLITIIKGFQSCLASTAPRTCFRRHRHAIDANYMCTQKMSWNKCFGHD